MSFQEKPCPHEAVSNLANPGIYVLEPEVLEKYVPEDTFFGFTEDVFPALLAAGEKVVGYDEGYFYWSDVGTLEPYRMAQRDALLGRVAVQAPGEQRGKGLWVRQRTWIHPSAYGHIKGHAVVGVRATIGPKTSLRGVVAAGDDCGISESVTVKQSVLRLHRHLAKTELVHRHRFPDREAARSAIFEYLGKGFTTDAGCIGL